MVYTMEWSRTPGHDMAGSFLDCPEDYGVPVPGMDGSAGVSNIRGTDLDAGSVVIDRCPSRMFVTAYLLTGSAKQAEAVLSASIPKLNAKATRDGSLSWKAIAPAILRGDPDLEPPRDETPEPLPVELQRVLRLSRRLRQCFVLRVLMAMPRQYCAELLRIDAEQVDANCRLAAEELARLAAGEAARGAVM